MLNTLIRPAHLKEADLFAVNARKLLHRKRDLLRPEQFNEYSGHIDELETVVRDADQSDHRARVEEALHKLDKKFGPIAPPDASAGWRENIEVILVAIVLAIAIRSYFLQPFKIPTGSMQPTLNGIIAYATPPSEPAPNVLAKAFQTAWFGRTYVEAVASSNDVITNLKAEKFLFSDYTRIECQSGRGYSVHATPDKVAELLGVQFPALAAGKPIYAGRAIVHGYVDTGDQVFVDKFTYNFRLPRRGDVFVFDTTNIDTERRADADGRIHSEYYIKRLGGLPGDTLRIEEPKLFINNALAEHAGFVRVMDSKDGYRGYANMRGYRFKYLLAPQDTFTVPANGYFALGDNSHNSSDSRVWGIVPAENVVGRGLFVYWPFTRHWGPIH